MYEFLQIEESPISQIRKSRICVEALLIKTPYEVVCRKYRHTTFMTHRLWPDPIRLRLDGCLLRVHSYLKKWPIFSIRKNEAG